MFLNHIHRMIEIICAQSMLYRLFNDAILLIPLTGTPVQNWQLFWLGLIQAVAQQIGKEMVIAVPTPLVVQGHDEQIGAF